MELTKETALFTVLLYCVCANSLPIDYPPNPYVPVSYIPDKGILPTPYSEVDKIDLPRQHYILTPSWHHIPPSNTPEVYEEEKKSQPKISSNPALKDVAKSRRKPVLDMILPNVKLGFAGLNGMVSKYKKDIGRPAAGPEPPTVIIKPGPNRSQPDEKDKMVEYKDGQPMFKPENPGMLQFKDTNSYRYTPPTRLERPRNMDYTTTSETDYGQFKPEEQSVRSYKTHLFDDVKNFDYPSYTKMSYDETPGNVYKTTLSPLKSKAIHTSPFNDKPVAQKPTYNYRSTQPIGEGDKQVELPPVPKTMPLLRRVYITLLNTISGLPGGNTGVLSSVRAG